ncbi:aminotransferase class IV [Acidisoma sp. 7E03]
MRVWLNGALLSAAEARIDPADRGFTLGDGLFETMRVAGGAPRHLTRHLVRLRRGCALLDLPCPYGDDALSDAMAVLFAAEARQEGVLRLTLSRGVMARGVLPQGEARPTILITARPLPPPLPPARLIVAETTRRNEQSPLSRIKSLNYLDAILARQEAAARGADDAVMLNTQGMVAEATAANLFMMRDGRIVTPRIEDGALPGIARALILERIAVEERPVSRADLQRAEALFLSNSLGVRAVAEIDGRALSPRPDLLRVLADP